MFSLHDSLDNAHKFQAVLSGLDVEVIAGSSLQFKKIMSDNPAFDLIIYELPATGSQVLPEIEKALVDDGNIPLLTFVRNTDFWSYLTSADKSDFVCTMEQA